MKNLTKRHNIKIYLIHMGEVYQDSDLTWAWTYINYIMDFVDLVEKENMAGRIGLLKSYRKRMTNLMHLAMKRKKT